jgi:hypothetical protein
MMRQLILSLILSSEPAKLIQHGQEQTISSHGFQGAPMNNYQMNSYEQMIFERLFEGGNAWVQAVFIAGLFGILIWRRESVVSWGLFRASYLFYGASLVMPPIIGPLSQFLAGTINRNPTALDSQAFATILVSATGPFLFAIAVACGLGSMIPRPTYIARPIEPTRHPLD